MEAVHKMYSDIGYGWSTMYLLWPGLRGISNKVYMWFAKNRLRWTGRDKVIQKAWKILSYSDYCYTVCTRTTVDFSEIQYCGSHRDHSKKDGKCLPKWQWNVNTSFSSVWLFISKSIGCFPLNIIYLQQITLVSLAQWLSLDKKEHSDSIKVKVVMLYNKHNQWETLCHEQGIIPDEFYLPFCLSVVTEFIHSRYCCC